MPSRTQITLDPETQRRARERAAQLGISFAEYMRRLVAHDLGPSKSTVDVSAIFDLGSSGDSDIARTKDQLIGESVAAEHRLKGVPR